MGALEALLKTCCSDPQHLETQSWEHSHPQTGSTSTEHVPLDSPPSPGIGNIPAAGQASRSCSVGPPAHTALLCPTLSTLQRVGGIHNPQCWFLKRRDTNNLLLTRG